MLNKKALLSAATLLIAACGGTQAPTAGPGGTAIEQPGAPGGETPAFPKEAFRAKAPESAEMRPLQLPALQTFELADSGVSVYLMEQHQLPVVSISIVMDGGARNDPRGREGQGSLCMALLTEGTRKLDKIAFREALADLGSSISSFSGQDEQGVSMGTLSKNFDASFALLADVLLSPGMRKKDLTRLVARYKDGLKQQRGTAARVASRLAYNVLYGGAHPYGRIYTESTLSKTTAGACKKLHRGYVKPEGARIFIAGDMTEKQVRDKFAPLLKRWKGKQKRSVNVAAPKQSGKDIYFVNIPGASQSTVYLMHSGPNRQDEQFYAHNLLARILGAGFTSRINMNLREDKGYSYGARGYFTYTREHGAFLASSSVRADATHQSLLEIIGEMKSIQSGKVPANDAELTRERGGSMQALPAMFETGGGALRQYQRLVYYGLPLDTYNTYLSKLSAVTLADVNGAASKLLRPEEAAILVVGDAEAKQLVNADGKDSPWMVDGKQVTLLESLRKLAGKERKVNVIDPDGRPAR